MQSATNSISAVTGGRETGIYGLAEYLEYKSLQLAAVASARRAWVGGYAAKEVLARGSDAVDMLGG